MEFSFSDEQDELRRQARRFLEVASSPERVRAAMETERGYDPEVWQELASELGWTALTIPEEYGGLGMSYLDLHPLVEEMGRALLCAPFFSTICLGANALLLGGSEEQKEKYLSEIAAGELTATLALTESSGRWDANGIEATYERDGEEVVLNGKKRYVVDGHSADLLIVAARSTGSQGNEGVSLFVVPGDADGLSRSWLPTVDQTRRLASLSLDGVRLPASALLGAEGEGWTVCEGVLDLANTALAAEQVGGSEACLDMSVEYAKVRKQFGRAIGSFQAIKHTCADMLTRLESARSAAFYASALAAQGHRDFPEAAAAAKAYCSDTFFRCAADNVQVHGGIGFTWEGDAHLFLKRAKATEALFGDATYHRARLADIVGF